jgi:RNA polymerase sigma-70 factor (ECF subfamily)
VDVAERQRVQEAMAALARGDRSAFRRVFAGLWPLLRTFCGRVLRDEALADDAAQGALMKLFLHATDFQSEGDAVGWALGIAAFECRSLINRRARRGEDLDLGALATVPTADPRSDLGAELRALVHTLRPIDRETLERALASTPPVRRDSAFRKRLQRALERVRAAWRQTHGSDH